MKLKDRRGAAALEFALLLWPFFAIIFAIADLGHYMMAQSQLRTLVGEVARAAMISCAANNGKLSSSCTTNPITDRAKLSSIAPMTFVSGNPPTITLTASSGKIAVTASMTSIPTFLPWWGRVAGGLTATTNLYY
ncbi:MAG: TadE/TadG family type IV pilus assembly protein [Acetobacteraceae bacterium]